MEKQVIKWIRILPGTCLTRLTILRGTLNLALSSTLLLLETTEAVVIIVDVGV